MRLKVIIPATLLLLTAFSCKKDDVEETTPPTITIEEPTEDHYHAGDTLHIHVDVMDEVELHEATFWLVALPQNDTLLAKKKHSHEKVITFEEDYIFGEFESDEQEVDLIITGENAAGKSTTTTFNMEVVDHH